MIIDYTCTNCGYHILNEVPIHCPQCNYKGCRIIYRKREKIDSEFCNVTGMVEEHIRYSLSGAVLAEDLESARKLHPHISEWKKFGNSYRPLIRNRAEKLKFMKQCGAYEY